MERADFMHLLHLSEQACAEDSRAYRRSVAAFAALGYAWVIACLLLGGGLLVWIGSAALRGAFRVSYLWPLLAAGGLLWSSLRALWLRLDEPPGVPLTPADAPALFDALERIRRKIKGPVIHRVVLDAAFNASIQQVPRWGLLGGTVNHLTLGLPLLMALDRTRLLAVLAHEYGHLRGDHGRFAAWIYRTRLSWSRLSHSLRDDGGPVAAATQMFLRWYFPRFAAKTFALARQDEYEADRIAGHLLGRDVTAAALTEVAIRSAWLQQVFWPGHWRLAAVHALPKGPFGSLQQCLAQPPDADFARDALRQALRRLSDVDDTHPVLRDRVEALQARKELPAWSSRAAIALLGPQVPRWIAHFDNQWCREHATDWKLHHAYLGRVQARVDSLSGSAARNNADEMAELGDLCLRLDPQAPVQGYYEQALKLTQDHAPALRGLLRSQPTADRAQRLAWMERLHASAAHRWWVSQVAVSELEVPLPDGSLDEKSLKLWRERLRQARETEQEAWEELTQTPCFQSITRHDLSEFELGEVQAELARYRPVAQAWLVRKQLREFPYRRCYLLFVDLPGLDDDTRYTLCRHLDDALSLPGTVLTLWAGHDPTLEDIRRQAFEPVFRRTAG